MNRTIRLLAAAMAAAFTLSALACGTAATPPAADTAATSGAEETQTTAADTTAAETTRTDYLAALPTTDYGGKTLNFLCRTEYSYEVSVDAEDGEVVNDAVFARNSRVCEKYNINITYDARNGMWGDMASFQKAITTAVKAGDSAYDIIDGYMAYCVPLAPEGNYEALNRIKAMDITAPWWVKGLVDNNTVYGNLFFISGDMSLSMWSSIYAVFFNKQLAENYSAGDLYGTVRDGGWTFDKLISLSQNVTQDVNGDGVYDLEDKYGFVTNDHSMRSIIISFGLPVAEKTDDGGYALDFYNDHTVEVFEKLYKFVNGNQSSYILPPTIDHAGGEYLSKIFSGDRALFMTFTLDMTDLLRDMTSDFGILPMPKYDDSQADYKSATYDGSDIFMVPVSASDYEFSGAMLDALGAESKYSVIPAFYDTKLKTKLTRDEDSAEMLDVIRSALTYDFGFVHSVSINYIFSLFGDLIGSGDETFASTYEKNASKYEELLAKVLKGYKELA